MIAGVVSQFGFIETGRWVERAFRPASKTHFRILEPRRGDTGKVRMCRTYGTRILRGNVNAGLKARSTNNLSSKFKP